MCGISGFINFSKKIDFNFKNISKLMINQLKHRGPDFSDTWTDNQNIALGHSRLSIIDLSRNGNQPMISTTKNYSIVYNGEIYNFLDIKKEINQNYDYQFQSNTDTEVLLAGIEVFGIKQMLQKCEGMFAFAIWDNKNKILHIARDRFGIKPLYYYLDNNYFVFSSELKPFKYFPKINLKIDLKSVDSFLKYNYVPAPLSIFQNIFKLQPGEYISINSKNRNIEKKYYWDVEDLIYDKKNKNSNHNLSVNKVENLIANSVSKHMISDVPVGTFLSGGIDSSLISVLAAKHSTNKIKTFTIGFYDNEFDEAKYAKKIANYIGTDHHEHYFDEKDLINLIPNIGNYYDEPFSDSSQLPTLLISKLASNHVKVVLTGDGGDEIFRGYNRYNWSNKLSTIIKILPQTTRSLFVKILNNENIIRAIGALPILNSYQNNKDKITKVLNLLKSKSNEELYQILIENNYNNSDLIKDNNLSNSKYLLIDNINLKSNFNLRMQITDIKNYLHDDILCKVDRASMSFGLETRVPFLDNNTVDYMMKVTQDKSNNSLINNKQILKNILNKHLPKNLFNRKKMGFAVPLSKWLDQDLHSMIDEIFSKANTQNIGIFDYNNLDNLLKCHRNGIQRNQYQIWSVLIFNLWYKNFFHENI